jgi:hypothetical protein
MTCIHAECATALAKSTALLDICDVIKTSILPQRVQITKQLIHDTFQMSPLLPNHWPHSLQWLNTHELEPPPFRESSWQKCSGRTKQSVLSTYGLLLQLACDSSASTPQTSNEPLPIGKHLLPRFGSYFFYSNHLFSNCNDPHQISTQTFDLAYDSLPLVILKNCILK